MFQDLKLSSKIWLGFGTVLGLTGILGIVTVISMVNVRSNSDILANEYAPEAEVATALERASAETMYAIRGYGFTYEESFLNTGTEKMKLVHESLKEAEALAAKASHLVKLRDQVKIAKEAVSEYEKQLEKTKSLVAKVEADKKAMNENAAVFVKSIGDYINDQDRKIQEEIQNGEGKGALRERAWKSAVGTDILELGSAIRVAAWKAQAERDPAQVEKAMGNFDAIISKVDQLLPVTREGVNVEQLNQTKRSALAYKSATQGMVENWKALEETGKLRGAAGEKVLDASETTSQAAITGTTKVSQDASGLLGTVSWVVIMGVLVAIGLGSAIATIIARSITLPIRNISSRLSVASDETASAAEQLSSASQRLAEGATEQASSLQETAATVEELNAMIHKAADNAKSTSDVVATSRENAVEGKNAVQNVLQAMNSIETSNVNIMNQVKDSNDKIGEIVKIINDIGNRTKVINEIVFQTKLLSFNASVEAARAGEHGKGFAVVAEEVGNLAQMSGNAAKEIEAMLAGSVSKVEGIVSETKSKVEALISEGKLRLEEGKRMVDNCDRVLEEIVAGSSNATRMANEVAQGAEQQSQGINEITSAISQLDQVTQENASTSEESAASAERLSEQALELRAAVNALVKLVEGKEGTAVNWSVATKPESRAQTPAQAHAQDNHGHKNVVSIKRGEKRKLVSNAPASDSHSDGGGLKKAVGFDGAPSESDPRFKEI